MNFLDPSFVSVLSFVRYLKHIDTMILRQTLFLLVLSFLGDYGLQAATISGQIELKQVQTRRANPRYGGSDSSLLGPASPFVGVVYLTREEGIDYSPPETSYKLSQRGLQFYPAVLPIELGSSVSFPNMDDTYHNVFSYSPEKRFDLGRYAKDAVPTPEVVFDEAGQIRVFCEVHEHMRAVVLVLDTPYFTTTDDTGSYSLEGVPAGEYTLNIWRVNAPLETSFIQVTEASKEE